MFQNWIGILAAGLLSFGFGIACGMCVVHRFRHVTTKALHKALLNCLSARTAALDRVGGRQPFQAMDDVVALTDGAERSGILVDKIDSLRGATTATGGFAEPSWPRLFVGQ
jgi:hypothetical protein